jgi:hypothetical protein
VADNSSYSLFKFVAYRIIIPRVMQFIATLGVGEKMENVVENTVEEVQEALKDLYKGELQADAIKQFASDYGWGETPAEPTQEELQRQRVVSGQNSLDTVIEASVPVEPVGIDDQINQAQADGDWQTSSNLKAEKLRALTKKQ